ncbi:uncharacterized protein AAG666_001778 isoform 4-T5 [Megaptera novaeangliae]
MSNPSLISPHPEDLTMMVKSLDQVSGKIAVHTAFSVLSQKEQKKNKSPWAQKAESQSMTQLIGEYFRLIRHTLLQGSISFEDVTVNFTQEEWGQLDPDQRTLCRALHYQTRGDLQVRARSTMDIRGRICKPLLPR